MSVLLINNGIIDHLFELLKEVIFNCFFVTDLPTETSMTADPANTTVLRESNLVLNCSTDANPDAHVYHYYFNGDLIGNSSSGVFNTTVMADGVYTCVPENTVGTQSSSTVGITAVGKLYICILYICFPCFTSFNCHKNISVF